MKRTRTLETATTEATISEIRSDRTPPVVQKRYQGQRPSKYPLSALKPNQHFTVTGSSAALRNAMSAMTAFRRRNPSWAFVHERTAGSVTIWRVLPSDAAREAADLKTYHAMAKEVPIPHSPVQ